MAKITRPNGGSPHSAITKVIFYPILALLGICFVLFSKNASATLALGTDLFFSGVIRSTHDFGLSSHNYLLFDLKEHDGMSLGPVINYEPLHSYMTDLTLGGGLRIQRFFYFEFDLGLFRRSYEDETGSGIAAGMLIGYSFTKVFSVSIPFTIKRIQTGFDHRFIFSTNPYLGFRLEI